MAGAEEEAVDAAAVLREVVMANPQEAAGSSGPCPSRPLRRERASRCDGAFVDVCAVCVWPGEDKLAAVSWLAVAGCLNWIWRPFSSAARRKKKTTPAGGARNCERCVWWGPQPMLPVLFWKRKNTMQNE